MTKKGIDISGGCGNIDLAAVKADGNDFVIVRAGYTGWGTGTQKVADEKFEEYYAAAKRAKLNVGAYWYSCANTFAKGVAEAQWMLENSLKGKQFEMPIYIDIEERRWQLNQAKGVTEAIIGFCETLEDAGYYAGVYSASSWFADPRQIDVSRLEAYTKWVACWSACKPTVKFGGFDIWQYAGNAVAYNTQVDLNEAYKDFPAVIKANGLNGFPKRKKATAKDVVETMKHIVGEGENGIDANGDGKINAKDVTQLMKEAMEK